MDVLNFISGRSAEPASGRWLDNEEPATGARLGRIPDSDEADVSQAVDAAANALPGWSSTPVSERAAVMNRIAALVARDLEPLARAESLDTGKPLRLAREMDIPRVAANFRFFAGAVQSASTQAYITDLPAAQNAVALNYTLRQPVGVVGLISPWNLPLYLLSWKIAPAIAAGNTCVCKPSELTPTTAHMLGALMNEAGLPAGAVNMVHGTGARAGAALVAHPGVRAISFTGGTSTGAAISRVAAPMFKKLSLELGGKNPTVIFDDVDLDEIVPQVVRASFTNQGQVCLCGSRILVSRSIFDRFLERFVGAVRALKVGDPLEPTTDLGALISGPHLKKVRSYVDLARAEGGTVVEGGVEPPTVPERCRAGHFHKPTVITGLGPNCRTQQEEIFGPVVTVTPFGDENEAVALANGTAFGLSASVWTRDAGRAHRVAARIEAGTVWVNCWLIRDLRVPFGGVKQSGVGREGGDEALRFFTEAKNVCIKYPM